MKSFANLRVGTKLMIGFGTLALLLSVVGVEGIRVARRVNALLVTVNATHAQPALRLKEANTLVVEISRAVRNSILDDSAAAVQERVAEIARADRAFRAEFKAYRMLSVTLAVRLLR